MADGQKGPVPQVLVCSHLLLATVRCWYMYHEHLKFVHHMLVIVQFFVFIFFFWYQNNQFVYHSFNSNKTAAMVLIDNFSWCLIFVLHLNFPYSTISCRKGFKHSTKLSGSRLG